MEEGGYLLMVLFAISIHAAIPNTSSWGGSCVGTMIWACGRGDSRAGMFGLGDTPGSEFGGEPNPAVRVFIKEPQLMVAGSESEGGVWVESEGPT